MVAFLENPINCLRKMPLKKGTPTFLSDFNSYNAVMLCSMSSIQTQKLRRIKKTSRI